MAPTRTAGASASIITPGSTKKSTIPVGAPTCLRKQEVGKPSLTAAQPYAKAEGCVHDDPPRADKLRKGWPFRVGTWNVDSLTGRSGEVVEALAERQMDVACVQETRWRGSGCRFSTAQLGLYHFCYQPRQSWGFMPFHLLQCCSHFVHPDTICWSLLSLS